MQKTHIIGIIGSGMIAREHLKNLALFRNARVKWISSAPADAAEMSDVQAAFGIPSVTVDYRDILKDPETSAVMICTPPYSHHGIFLDCIEHGKNILLEKPAAVDEAQITQMLNIAARFPDIKILDASCRHSRLQPKFRFVKDLLDSGRLGEVYFIHHNAVYRQERAGIEYHPTAKWFLDRSRAGGGPVLDWGVYDLSFHLGILGDEPELNDLKSFSMNGLDTINPGTEIFDVEEHAASLMSFHTGLKYYWERGSHANVEVPDETRIYGTRGGARFSYLSWESPVIEIFGLDRNNKPFRETVEIPREDETGDGYALIRHFLAVLDGKEAPAMPLPLAAKHLKIIFENYHYMQKMPAP